MKKSQIMAVFALALALGAVAPIAGVVSSASAYEHAVYDKDGRRVKKGTASYDENGKAIDCAQTINNNYASLIAFYNTAKRVYKIDTDVRGVAGITKGTVTLINATAFATISDTVKALIGEIDGYYTAGTEGKTSDTNIMNALTGDAKLIYNAGTTNANRITIDNAREILAAVKAHTYGYAEFQGIANAQSVAEYEAGHDAFSHQNTFLIAPLARNNFSGAKSSAVYASYKRLYTIVSDAEQAINTYEQALADITNAYENVKGALNTAGITAYATATTPKIVRILDIINVVLADGATDIPTDTMRFDASGNVKNGSGWNAVTNQIKNNEGLGTSLFAETYYTAIADLATQFKVASGDYDADAKIESVIDDLLTCKKSTNGGTTNGGTGDDQNGDNTDADVNAPNTGILSSAEGSATTISIVAGLTTALASLGAGVVAYRSARRGE